MGFCSRRIEIDSVCKKYCNESYFKIIFPFPNLFMKHTHTLENYIEMNISIKIANYCKMTIKIVDEPFSFFLQVHNIF